jgi:hypothetical protein
MATKPLIVGQVANISKNDMQDYFAYFDKQCSTRMQFEANNRSLPCDTVVLVTFSTEERREYVRFLLISEQCQIKRSGAGGVVVNILPCYLIENGQFLRKPGLTWEQHSAQIDAKQHSISATNAKPPNDVRSNKPISNKAKAPNTAKANKSNFNNVPKPNNPQPKPNANNSWVPKISDIAHSVATASSATLAPVNSNNNNASNNFSASANYIKNNTNGFSPLNSTNLTDSNLAKFSVRVVGAESFRVVLVTDHFEAAWELIRANSSIGIDCEMIQPSNNLSIAQIYLPQQHLFLIIDVMNFAIRPHLIALLNQIMAAPSVRKIFHAFQQDLMVLSQAGVDAATNVIDTQYFHDFYQQLAQGKVNESHVSAVSISLLKALEAHGFPPHPLKSNFAHDCWHVRPLTDVMLEYACYDVLHLPKLEEKLTEDIAFLPVVKAQERLASYVSMLYSSNPSDLVANNQQSYLNAAKIQYDVDYYIEEINVCETVGRTQRREVKFVRRLEKLFLSSGSGGGEGLGSDDDTDGAATENLVEAKRFVRWQGNPITDELALYLPPEVVVSIKERESDAYNASGNVKVTEIVLDEGRFLSLLSFLFFLLFSEICSFVLLSLHAYQFSPIGRCAVLRFDDDHDEILDYSVDLARAVSQFQIQKSKDAWKQANFSSAASTSTPFSTPPESDSPTDSSACTNGTTTTATTTEAASNPNECTPFKLLSLEQGGPIFSVGNRAGINGTLHRISCMRDRNGLGITGLTYRIGMLL